MTRGQAKTTAADEARGALTPNASALPYGFHPARAVRKRFHLDMRRSLRMHPWLALGIAVFGLMLTAAYLVRFWPEYTAETLVYIQPAPEVAAGQGVAMHWPYNYDPATYEPFVQQQMLSMTRIDVLKGALTKLPNYEKSGESDEDAAERLRQSVNVARVGDSFEVSIKAHAGNAQMSADVANAVAASYIENTSHEQRVGDTERLNALRQEADSAKTALDADRAAQAGLSGQYGLEGNDTQQQASELAADIARLQSRYDAVDAEIKNLVIEDAAPQTAHVTTAAVVPASPAVDGTVQNAAILLAAFLLLALLAAVAAHKLDPRLYVATDVEQVLGFAPIAQLPDFSDVSSEVAEEQLLRLSAAVEQAFMQGNRKSCVLTGTSPGTGVTTIATRIRSLLEGINRPAALVDAVGKSPVIWPSASRHDEARDSAQSRETRPLMLIRRLAEEAHMRDGTVVLADAAPLVVSADTEYLARNSDCVIVVMESGVTTRAELRATAGALKRLDAPAVGYVLNRVALAKADAAFRSTLRAAEDHVRVQSRTAESEPVRTRRVEAEPARRWQEPAAEPVRQAESTMWATEPMKPAPAVAEVRETAQAAQERPPAPPPVAAPEPAPPQPPPAVAEQPPAGPSLPWWLATLKTPSQEPVRAPFVGTPEAAQSERTAAPSEAAPVAQESRLSGLRGLFTPRIVAAAGHVPEPAPVKEAAFPPLSKSRETLRGIHFGPGSEARRPSSLQGEPAPGISEAPGRRATPEVTTLPEYLPPRETPEAPHEENAPTRLDRRDSADDVAILPSWRGQYRKKE